MKALKAVDLYCGGGGTSRGLLKSCAKLGLELDLLAINHWDVAVRTHSINHPHARHICASLEGLEPERAAQSAYLDLLVASPECTHHSVARGGVPCSDQSRASAWHVVHWCEKLRVKRILIENVPEFENWGPLSESSGRPLKQRKGETFKAFVGALVSLGYQVEWRVLNAADYGDATSRRRLFIMGRRGKEPIRWPDPTNCDPRKGDTALPPWRTAREIIDWDHKGKSIFDRERPLRDSTLRRIAAGLRKFGGPNAEPFLVMLYGSNHARSIDRPLPTVTASGQHIGLCQPFLAVMKGQSKAGDIRFRMLAPLELQRATGFEDDYFFFGNRAQVVKQIGNAVPTYTACELCTALLS